MFFSFFNFVIVYFLFKLTLSEIELSYTWYFISSLYNIFLFFLYIYL